LAIESNLLNWEFPAIVNDIKRELSRRTAGFREKGLGGINYFFDPTGRGNKFDPLEGMRTDSELQSAATILLHRPNERENQIFTDRAITMLTQIFHAGLLEEQRLLPFTQKIIFEGLYGAAAILEIISRQHNVYPNLATRFLDVDFRHADFKDKFLLDCWGTMSNRMNRLLTRESVRCFTGSDFTPRDIITSEKPITVYLCWPEKDLLSLSPLVHLVWTSLMDGMLSAYDDVQEGRLKATCYPVLAVLDEIGRTGFPNLPEYSTTVAGRNISLLIAVQSISQLDAIYGKNKADVLRDNMDTQIFYRPASLATAEYIERKLGYKSGFAHSKTDHEGSVSKGESEQRVPVMTVQQIMQMGDEEIICCGSQWKRVRLAIEHLGRPTIIDSTQGVWLTLIATKPTIIATDQGQVLPALYGEFFGR
jgi:type IV secretion system protein VirD4